MRSDGIKAKKFRLPVTARILIGALVWLVVISSLHYWLNVNHGKRRVIRMGYMPVITNLACPLLDYTSRTSGDVRFAAIKFASFADMSEALQDGKIDAAFIIAPLAIVLRQEGKDIKIVYIGNRDESTLVVKKNSGIKRFTDLAGRTVAIPMRYSGHYLCLKKLAEQYGISKQIKIVEMNPPDMASAMTVGSLDAYFVGEPFAAQTVKNGSARVLLYVQDAWKGFICNLLVVRHDFIKKDPEIVAEMVQTAARSGLWAKQHTRAAAKIASQYWNQPVPLVTYALTHPPNRIMFDRFVPKYSELKYMADLMVHFHLIKNDDISGLIDDRFAKQANLKKITDIDSLLVPAPHIR